MRTLFLAFCIALTACGSLKTSKETADTLVTETQTPPVATAAGIEEDMDSLITRANAAALLYANGHLNEGAYTKNWIVPAPSDSIRTYLSFGNLFEAGRKHLHIRTNSTWGVFDYVYGLQDGTFKLFSADTADWSAFVMDSIGEVNGDQFRDYMFVIYPSSGCCRRYSYKLYRYDVSTGAFGVPHYLMNPDFFPDEKVIRGVTYGQPGEAALYKSAWKDTLLEDLEYIYWNVDDDNQFIRSKVWLDHPDGKSGEILKAVPEEYRHIQGYSWFTFSEK